MLAHLAAVQLDRVMDREEVARPRVDSAVAILFLSATKKSCSILKLSGRSIGFLINWKVTRIKDGIQRMIWQKR
jgi:hypothetical protein